MHGARAQHDRRFDDDHQLAILTDGKELGLAFQPKACEQQGSFIPSYQRRWWPLRSPRSNPQSWPIRHRCGACEGKVGDKPRAATIYGGQHRRLLDVV